MVFCFGVFAAEEPADAACLTFANGFAIPAGAFGVRFAVRFLVSFGCPGEGIVEFGLGDFVVVVDELTRRVCGVLHVAVRGELVRMPGQIDIESRHGHVVAVFHDGDEALVFDDEAFHCVP